MSARDGLPFDLPHDTDCSAQEIPQVIDVEKATVLNGRLILDVRVSPAYPLETTPEIAASALRLCPALEDHACVNRRGPTFGAVIASTSIPHLFEHLIIDEQVRLPETSKPGGRSSRPRAAFTGSTEWTDRAQRRARVQVSFEDDIEALAAVTRAQAILQRIFA